MFTSLLQEALVFFSVLNLKPIDLNLDSIPSLRVKVHRLHIDNISIESKIRPENSNNFQTSKVNTHKVHDTCTVIIADT